MTMSDDSDREVVLQCLQCGHKLMKLLPPNQGKTMYVNHSVQSWDDASQRLTEIEALLERCQIERAVPDKAGWQFMLDVHNVLSR